MGTNFYKGDEPKEEWGIGDRREEGVRGGGRGSRQRLARSSLFKVFESPSKPEPDYIKCVYI